MAEDSDQTIFSLIFGNKKGSKDQVAKTQPKKTDSLKEESKLEEEYPKGWPSLNIPLNPQKISLFFKNYWLYFLILTILVFVTYSNSLGNDLVSDDKGLLIDKNNLTKLSYIFSDPLSFIHSLMFAVLTAIFGINAFILRLLNVFFHLGNTYLVLLIISLLLNPLVGMVTASLFAVHPLLTEAVVWISGGPYSQYAFFFLLSFFFYMVGAKRPKFYIASLVIFLVALLESNRVMTLFPIFIVYEFFYGSIKKNWKKLLPFVAISILWGIVYVIQIGGRQTILQSQYYLEKGFDNPFIQIPFAISNYLIMFFWPQNLTFYHSDLLVTYTILALYWGILLGFLGLLVFTFFKNKFLFFWLSFFIISLMITLTPFRIAWIVAERYVYLGMIGLLAVVAWVFEWLYRKKNLKIITFITFIIIITSLGVRSIVRNTDWKNEKSLFLAVERTTPSSPKAHNNLGSIYTDEKNYALAEKELVQAIKLKPNYGDAYYNYGYLKQVQNKYDDAVKLYGAALKINPNLYQAYRNLGAIYFMAGKTDEALQFTQKAIQIQPKDADLYTNLAIIYMKTGPRGGALEAVVNALRINPKDQKAAAIYQQLQELHKGLKK